MLALMRARLSSPSCSRSCGLAADWCRGDRFRVGGRRLRRCLRRLTRADAVDMPAGNLAPGIVGDEDGVRLTALGVRERAPGGEGAAGGRLDPGRVAQYAAREVEDLAAGVDGDGGA